MLTLNRQTRYEAVMSVRFRSTLYIPPNTFTVGPARSLSVQDSPASAPL